MNKVTCKNRTPIYTSFLAGDLFVNSEGKIFILSKIALPDSLHPREYVCICLKSGVNWNFPNTDISVAFAGLQFLCRGAEIEVTAPKD